MSTRGQILVTLTIFPRLIDDIYSILVAVPFQWYHAMTLTLNLLQSQVRKILISIRTIYRQLAFALCPFNWHHIMTLTSTTDQISGQSRIMLTCTIFYQVLEVERVPQFRYMFLTIFSTILCNIIVHPPNKHHIKVFHPPF